MSISSILYTLLIYPLEVVFTLVFTVAYYVTSNYGLAICGLSLVINILVLPLYKRADAIQEEENRIEKKLEKGVSHIKKTFSGDERFMILQTYYKQNNYKQTYVLRGLLPLLLEIPFFMAAYNFLSNLSVLEGVSFFVIKDLGVEDGLLGGINLLPILMTLINIVSSFIYTKEAPLKTRIQLFAMASVFLVLLYDSPSGLVLYWTLNNLFSLVKNIISQLKKPLLVVGIISSFVSAIGLIYILFIHQMTTFIQQVFVIAVLTLLNIPLLISLLKDKIKFNFKKPNVYLSNATFYICMLFIALLIGFYIPSSVINSSAAEFLDRTSLVNPANYVIDSLLTSVGLFAIWPIIYYLLSSQNIKKYANYLSLLLVFVFVVNYLCFDVDLGYLSNTLVYDDVPVFLTSTKIINIVVIIALIALVTILRKYISKFINLVLIAALVSLIAISTINLNNINKTIETTISDYKKASSEITIPMSKDGENVIIIMLDRAMSGYIPYLFNERQDLYEIFDGFTYYPNTISYGGYTKAGLPSLIGGYEYTPIEMNKRDTESMVEKHNEALKVLPVLFSENDYEVTVCDPTYANYKEVPDLSIYDDYDINTYITKGAFNFDYDGESYDRLDLLRKKLMYYSFMKVMPICVQNIIYNYGFYNDIEILEDENVDLNSYFVNSYFALEKLDEITTYDSKSSTFLFMTNETTHSPATLQLPEYEPVKYVDDSNYSDDCYIKYDKDGNKIELNTQKQKEYYQINMASLLKLGEWFNQMKENGTYDNSKIIIVSDHSYSIGQFEELIFDDNDLSNYNPLLLVKEVNQHGFTTSDEFMTNADVATLATNNTIENPINPFTGNKITNDAKQGNQYIIKSGEDNGNVYEVSEWLVVKDNIYDSNNWKIVSSIQ